MTDVLDETHDPALRSWVESANDLHTDFPIQNLPLGVFRARGSREAGRIGVAIGNQIFDLRQASARGLLHRLPAQVRQAVEQPSLNRLMALGREAAAGLRLELSRFLRADSRRREPGLLVPMAGVEMLMPATIGHYTDFYASIHHALTVGRLFRPDNPLQPNYKHIPVAYHSRASSIVVSGTPVRRPWGQVRPGPDTAPVFQPTAALDYELEVGVFVGRGNALGEPVPIGQAEAHLFGLCLLNDWSARDIQMWENVPLGPFLSKSFASSVSPWVVTLEALAPFRCALPRGEQDPAPLPYLTNADVEARGGIDLQVEAVVRSPKMREAGQPPRRLTRSSLRHMYWTVAQMLTHHTSNGCNLQPADLLGTGTVTGPGDDEHACLLEITRQGKEPWLLPSGETRTYLEDGDEVVLRGWCEREGFRRIGFGECRSTVLPAVPYATKDRREPAATKVTK